MSQDDDSTFFQFLVFRKGFEGGKVLGPRGESGTITTVVIDSELKVRVRWTERTQKPVLPLIFPLNTVRKIADGEKMAFQVQLGKYTQNLWKLSPRESTKPPPPWAELIFPE